MPNQNDSPFVIDLDRMHRATRIHARNTWTIEKRDPNGNFIVIERWHGPRRSIFAHLARQKIVPSRTAEEQIAELPERPEFTAA